MKYYKLFFIPVVIALLFIGCTHSDSGPDGNFVIYDNAVIYTCEDELPEAQAMVVEDGKIVYVGTRSGAGKYKNATSQVIDMQGKTILPGMIDSHVHPGLAGFLMSAGTVPLVGMNLAEVQAALKEFLKENPEADMIVGMAFDRQKFGLKDGEYPTAKELDVVSTDIPILLFDDGCHSSWVNNKALQLAKIDKNTPDPKEGVDIFIRYADGTPTGYMLEKAFLAVGKATPLFNLERVTRGISSLLSAFSAVGVTAICDAGGLFEIEYQALSNLQADGKLNFHYQKANIAIEDDPEASLEKLKELDKKYTKDNFRCNLYKILMDGTLEVETASLIAPYESGHEGKQYISTTQAIEHTRTALTAGYPIHTHVIGDKAQRDILDAYLANQSLNPYITRAIAHNCMFEPDGLTKYEQMKSNLTCQSTPNWAHPESVEVTKEKIGEERFKHLYLWGQLMNAGVNVAFGCDLPANDYEALNPFMQIHSAVMRKLDDSYFPPREAGLTVQQALKACTINGARQMMIDDITGSLKAGKYADFIVIDRDITKVNPNDIINTEVEQTYFRGNLVQ